MFTTGKKGTLCLCKKDLQHWVFPGGHPQTPFEHTHWQKIGIVWITVNIDTWKLQCLYLDEYNRKKKGTLCLCKKKKTYSTGYSKAVTHPSTIPAQCYLTSVIRREFRMILEYIECSELLVAAFHSML